MTLHERDDVRGRCVPESVAIREPRTERRTMTKAVRSDRKRVVVAEAEDQTYHRKGWQEPAEAPAESYCWHCHRRVPYLVWRGAEWLCVVCAEAK